MCRHLLLRISFASPSGNVPHFMKNSSVTIPQTPACLYFPGCKLAIRFIVEIPREKCHHERLLKCRRLSAWPGSWYGIGHHHLEKRIIMGTRRDFVKMVAGASLAPSALRISQASTTTPSKTTGLAAK